MKQKELDMDPADVHGRDSFIQFLNDLRHDLRQGSEDWVNVDLDDFLESMGAWVKDSQSPAHKNPWTHAAQLLLSASGYE